MGSPNDNDESAPEEAGSLEDPTAGEDPLGTGRRRGSAGSCIERVLEVDVEELPPRAILPQFIS